MSIWVSFFFFFYSLGIISGRSSDIKPAPFILAISPWIHTAAQQASKISMSCAINPVIIPDKTSPEPPVAKKGDVFVLIDIRPSCEQIIVAFPFKIKLILVFFTKSVAAKILLFIFLIFKLFIIWENSPWWGVITNFVLFFDNIFLKLFFKASASKMTILFLSLIAFKI